MASAALRAWEALIKHLQPLSNDDLPVMYGLAPCVVMSGGAATSLENAFQVVRALPEGNKASCRRLLGHKVSCARLRGSQRLKNEPSWCYTVQTFEYTASDTAQFWQIVSQLWQPLNINLNPEKLHWDACTYFSTSPTARLHASKKATSSKPRSTQEQPASKNSPHQPAALRDGYTLRQIAGLTMLAATHQPCMQVPYRLATTCCDILSRVYNSTPASSSSSSPSTSPPVSPINLKPGQVLVF